MKKSNMHYNDAVFKEQIEKEIRNQLMWVRCLMYTYIYVYMCAYDSKCTTINAIEMGDIWAMPNCECHL